MSTGYPNLMCFGRDVSNCPIVESCPDYEACNKRYDDSWLSAFEVDESGYVYDDNGDYVSPLDDDYGYWESQQENFTNPLSDDYCKYDNE